MRGKGDKNVCWRPEHLLKGFLKSETQHGLKWRNEGFYMCQLSFTQRKLPRKTIQKKSLFWPMVSEFQSMVTRLSASIDVDRGKQMFTTASACDRGGCLLTVEGNKRRKAKSPPPEVSTTTPHHTPPYVSYQTFSSWRLGEISDPNSLSFISILCKNTSCLHSMAFKALTILVLLKSLLKKKKKSRQTLSCEPC